MIAIPYALLMALIAVESSGNDNAIGRDGERGCLQIHEIVRQDIKRITGKTIYPHQLFDRSTSCQIALIYLNHYATPERLGRPPTLRDYALIWHYGPKGWKKPDPDPYWEKVKKHLPP
jgi:soluble lytic murein transglycosylase-like protein